MAISVILDHLLNLQDLLIDSMCDSNLNSLLSAGKFGDKYETDDRDVCPIMATVKI